MCSLESDLKTKIEVKLVHFGGDFSREQEGEKESKSIIYVQLDQLPLWEVELHPTGEPENQCRTCLQIFQPRCKAAEYLFPHSPQ